MAMTGLDSFDTSVQKSEKWLRELMEKLEINDRHRAYGILRTVLLALRDQLTLEESANLSAQLPLVIRGVYYDRWKPSAVPMKIRSREQFVDRVETEMKDLPGTDTEQAIRAVLQVLSNHVTEGELRDSKSILPDELKGLFPF